MARTKMNEALYQYTTAAASEDQMRLMINNEQFSIAFRLMLLEQIGEGDCKKQLELYTQTMTSPKAIKLLIEEQKNRDTEMAHSNADNILCLLLKEMGYNNVVDEYEKIRKW